MKGLSERPAHRRTEISRYWYYAARCTKITHVIKYMNTMLYNMQPYIMIRNQMWWVICPGEYKGGGHSTHPVLYPHGSSHAGLSRCVGRREQTAASSSYPKPLPVKAAPFHLPEGGKHFLKCPHLMGLFLLLYTPYLVGMFILSLAAHQHDNCFMM